MITENKVVLSTNSETIYGLKYEAIVPIGRSHDVETIWRCNKTPIIMVKDVTLAMKKRYSILEIPTYIVGEEDFTAFCHRNGIECGEVIEGKKFDTSKESCFLCDIANHMGIKGPTYVYNKKTKNETDMIIYESSNFFVKIELGCMKKGMLMVCPNEHILSAAAIPDKILSEYQQVLADIEFILKGTYGDETVIFFEHGSSPDGYSSHKRSIVHAHTHVAWGVRFEQKYLDMVSLKYVEDIRMLRGKKYLSYQEGIHGKLLAVSDPLVYVQRQYPRQIIGLMLGIENEKTNWRKEPFLQNCSDTFKDIYMFLEQNKQFLNPRIVKATEGFVKGYPLR